MSLLPCFLLLVGPAGPTSLLGRDVGVRLIWSKGEIAQELVARQGSRWQVILVSPTHPRVKGGTSATEPALRMGGAGLFQSAPTFGFQRASLGPNGRSLVLTSDSAEGAVTETLNVPDNGNTISVSIDARIRAYYPRIDHLLASYAFAPGTPDTTWTPALRIRDDAVIGDHFFRSPVVVAQKGPLAACLMPDLDVLAENRPIPTILDLDCRPKISDLPLLSYGFADYRRIAHVAFAHDAAMVKPVPRTLTLAFQVRLDADAPAHGAYQAAAQDLWERYGHRYLDRILPQAMPFAEYAKVCYPAAFAEKESGGWFETAIDGQVCGGVPSGWGRDLGWVSWQDWFNQLRSAWGLRWWGKKLNQPDWVDRADKMLNLALAAPLDQGACPTTYDSHNHEWRGCLITPDPACYYDLTNMAWKGIWLLRWLQFPDCPRRDEVERQVSEMAALTIRMQNPDGSFPTWLDKNLKVVPILDRSAQSALPTWFLAQVVLNTAAGTLNPEPRTLNPRLRNAALKGAEFLAKNIVDQQRYYDFETFFSCSPKTCLQIKGSLDDPAMMDPHTLQRPQNTLSMEWTAEALKAAAELESSPEGSQAVEATGEHLSSTLNPEPGTLNPEPGTLNPEPGTLNPEPGTLNPDPRTLNPDPRTLNPDPRTLNPEPRTRNPEPATLDPALKALSIMDLYQVVWPISYRQVAYTYGGFGVQNSDGEYNDARQAQFAETLCDFGAATGRQDLFERGVAAARASLALINHPLHEELGIYPNPNYPLGLEPENDGHDGHDEQDGRTGFDWGEGSGLAAIAAILDKYGSTYTWTPAPEPRTRNPEPAAWTVLVDGVQPGSKPRPRAPHPEPVLDPAFDFSDWRMPGWTFDGDFLHWPTDSTRLDFGNQGQPFIGTCEDGSGSYDDAYTGTITSPPFRVTKSYLKLLVGGGSGPGEYVELIDEAGKQIYVERGHDSEHMDERTWSLLGLGGKVLRIRIVDHEKGGWGHINVGNIRCTN